MRQCCLIVWHVADHWQVIAGGAAHAAAGGIGADIHVQRPLRVRETVDQPLPVVLLIFLAEGGVGLPAMVAGANTVLLILRIMRRQVAIVAQHLAQGGKPRGGRYMTDLAANRVDRQLRGLRKIRDAVAVRQHHRLMIALLIEQPTIALRAERFNVITIVHVQSASGRQRQQFGGELLRAQPAAGRISDAAAAGIDAGQPDNLFRRHRAGDVRG